MQNIVGTRIHDEILGLIDRATEGVILVSPFVKMWPDLRRAIARAVARDVGVSLITRGPKGGPRDEDLALFEDLECEVQEVPDLHLKAYLSEREAIYTSVNLTRQSVDKSLESSLLFSRLDDPEGWNNVFEVWNKTRDDAARARESGPIDFETILVPLRTRADSGDAKARERHRYCILCGATASGEADEVVCVRCRAQAIASDTAYEALVGARCTRCNGAYRRSTAERPFCDSCYRIEMDRYDRRPADWYVSGSTGVIEAWARLQVGRARPEFSKGVNTALAHRWGVLLPPGGWFGASLTALTHVPLTLWTTAMPPEGVDVGGLAGVLLERVPTKALPVCRDLPSFETDRGMHVAFARTDAPRTPIFWEPEQVLATWDLALPGNPDDQTTLVQWLLGIAFTPRKAFRPGSTFEPGRTHLQVDLDLTVPSGHRQRWKGIATFLQQTMLSALHTYDPAEVREWLKRPTSKAVEAIIAALAGPAPLGPAQMARGSKGQINGLPGRPDRVAVVRVALADGDSWHMTGAVSKLRKLPVH